MVRIRTYIENVEEENKRENLFFTFVKIFKFIPETLSPFWQIQQLVAEDKQFEREKG